MISFVYFLIAGSITGLKPFKKSISPRMVLIFKNLNVRTRTCAAIFRQVFCQNKLTMSFFLHSLHALQRPNRSSQLDACQHLKNKSIQTDATSCISLPFLVILILFFFPHSFPPRRFLFFPPPLPHSIRKSRLKSCGEKILFNMFPYLK